MNLDIIKKSRITFAGVIGVTFLSTQAAYALVFNIVPKSGTSLPTTVPYNGSVYAFYTVQNNTSMVRYGNTVRNLPANVSNVTTHSFYSDTCGASFDLAPKGQSGDSCTLQLLISGAVNGLPKPFVCFAGNTKGGCAGTNSQLNVTVESAVNYSWTNTGLTGSTFIADLAGLQNSMYTGGLLTTNSRNYGELWKYNGTSAWDSQFTNPIYGSRINALIPNALGNKLLMAEGNVSYGDVATFTPGDTAPVSICSSFCASNVSTINDLSLGEDDFLYAAGGNKSFPVIGDVWRNTGGSSWESTGFSKLRKAPGYWLSYVPEIPGSTTQSPQGLYVASYLTAAESDTPVVYKYAGTPKTWSNTFIPTSKIDILHSLTPDDAGVLYALGSSAASGTSHGAILTYSNAGTWQHVQAPHDSGAINVIAFLNDGRIVIGGQNLRHQGAVWIGNGTNGWTNTGLQSSEMVTSLSVLNDQVYAGGYNNGKGVVWLLSIQ